MKRILYLLTLTLMLAGLLSGCQTNNRLDPKKPVTLTLWHTYGEPMVTSLDMLVDEFNSTIGVEKGIVVATGLVADPAAVNEKLLVAADGDPGAPQLPDLAVVNPNIAVKLANKGLLTDLASQFSEQELSGYVPAFLAEGKLGGDKLYILPIAKSTEVLYVNTTIFDRFAQDTGVTLAQLTTCEGIREAAEKYYAWTDAKTPAIPNDGKAFYYPEELSHFAMAGYAQLGGDFVSEQRFNLASPLFQRIWDAYYPPAVQGGVAIFDKYNSYLMQIGDVVCATATSAGVNFCPGTVTYADNRQEPLTIAILPYPVFDGGKKVALQRGGGMCVFKSNEQKEYAAAVFLKWLTEPEQNLRFTAQTGYMPVTLAAFDDYATEGANNASNENIKKVIETIAAMQEEYSFYVPPVFDGLNELQGAYESAMRQTAADSRREYLGLLAGQSQAQAYDSVSKGVFEKFTAEH
ncbi:MAG: extracellular solute-binding protein [Firmicutes bacterium]|nr:extracellular solute-binding protein [Bacillota bacterium]